MVGNKLHPTMLFRMLLLSSWKMRGFKFHTSKFTSFHCLILNLFISELTLCYWLIAFAPWLMLSLLIPLEHIWFCGLLHLMGNFDSYYHCWSHLSIFDFASCFVSQGGHDNSDLCKMTLLWSTFDICIFPPCCKGFWLLAPTSKQFSLSMC
jgi:hypothetical protein